MEFRYQARDAEGDLREGAVDADTLEAASRLLVARGLYPIEVAAATGAAISWSSRLRGGRGGRLRPAEQALFVRQLSDLLAAGVPLVDALAMLGRQSQSAATADRATRLAEAVRDGASIATALEERPGTLPLPLVAVVRAGEASGALDQVVASIADLLEKEAELRDKVRQALIYPAIVTVASALTLAVLFGYLIPRLSVLYVDMGQELPTPTRILLETADLARTWGVPVFVVLATGYLVTTARMRRSAAWARRVGGWSLALPRIGEVIRSREIVQFARTLATLIVGGVPVLESLRLSERACGNPAMAVQLREVHDRVQHGDSLSQALATQPDFAGPLITMVEVGERGGTLPTALERAAAYYGRSLESRLQDFVRFLEPALILVLALVVGFIVFSMMLPILELNLGPA